MLFSWYHSQRHEWVRTSPMVRVDIDLYLACKKKKDARTCPVCHGPLKCPNNLCEGNGTEKENEIDRRSADIYKALAEGYWLIERPDTTGKTYSPLEDKPALFQHFAHTVATREAICLFANEHGPLGAHRRTVKILGTERIGEPFDMWKNEIRRMRYAVDVWEAVRGNDWKRLRRWIRLNFDRKGRFQGAWFRRFEADRTAGNLPEKDRPPSPGEERLIVGEGQPLARYVPPGTRHHEDLQRVGLFYVQAEINKQLDDHSTGLRLLFNPETDTCEQRAVPTNLLGAMWSQFAQDVTGNKKRGYGGCVVCGAWFEMARPHAKYCSARCRVQNHRNRRVEACRRDGGGISHDEIAADLGTTVETVSGWVDAAEEKRKQQQEKKGR